MAVYLTRTRVKNTLRIPAGITQHDATIDDLLDPAEEAVLGYVGMPALTMASYNETFDIDSAQNYITFDALPIATIAALTNDGSAVAATDYDVNTTTGVLQLKTAGSFFTEGVAKVTATYTAGENPVPKRYHQAAAIIAADMFHRGAHAGLETEAMGGYRVRLSDEEVPPAARSLLNRSRRVLAR